MTQLELTPSGTAPTTMTSTEVAELTGKSHSHVMRDIRKLKEDLGAMFEGSIQNWIHPQNGQTYEEFALTKDTCLTLLLGYDAVARMKVVKRWQELEAKAAAPALPDFSNPATAARAWADAVELAQAKAIEVAQQRARLSIVGPKADALDLISTSSVGSMCITNAAKALQMQPKRLFAWLQAKRWIYLRFGGSGWVGYQDRINNGFVEHKLTPAHRTSEYYLQVLVTAKGLAKLATDIKAQAL